MEQKVIKLQKEDLDKIQELQSKFININIQLGQILLERESLKKIQDSLFSEYSKLKENEEKKLIDEIGKKYGFGKLDMNKGELTINDENK